ncbi:diacylglycerol/lipid kinase family protein [Scrofimicrobium sp. R131]|uniref:Diacylglycerol kinase family protein n=1 Tax=Scrofimicrobium appendicitidis TaxID=3079930 RepID=A0AAU7V7F5_9ACTO
MNGPMLVLLYALVVSGGVSAALLRTLHRRPAHLPRPGGKTVAPGRVWVIANPTKPDDYARFQQTINTLCQRMTGHPAQWLETTREDPGTGQAAKALATKPAVVIAAGGDGTVRAVAAGLAHSGVPMGIIPVGTGNLVARNLGLPLDLPSALEVAVSGRTAPIDLAWLRLERVSEPGELPAEGGLLRALRPEVDVAENEFAYLVIAGIGFDGETMANTSARLKRAVGWSAYVFTALKSLRIERMKATVTLYHPQGVAGARPKWAKAVPPQVYQAIEDSHTLGQDAANQDRYVTGLRARTVLMANCGTLPFTVLAPYAEIDDGLLDVIAIDTKGGLFGWINLAAKVLAQSVGLRPFNLRRDLGQISFQQCHAVQVDTNRPYPVQVDGDPVGTARTVITRLDEGALLMRHPWLPSTTGALLHH